jgi:hypothetical protein
MRPITIILFLILLAAPVASAQESISGVVNDYTWVSHVDYCTNTIVVGNPFLLKKGMRALLIQMQGASIDSSNSPEFGRITSYNNAGSYEVVTVDRVIGESVTLESPLLNRYDSAGRVQLVTIPRYGDAVVEGIVTTPAWDGSVGGVIAIEVEGTLTLHADIDAGGKGFHGGRPSINRDLLSDSSWFFPYSQGTAGEKGEGIAAPVWQREAGRNALANGGGGGNPHNAGGGGGSNGASGGKGGGEGGWGFDIPVGGMGGWTLRSAIDSGRIFMGGGGGGGHQNNNEATGGGRGGGIVLIIATKIAGNGYRIAADGDSAQPAGLDGAGGGGAGGTILLDAGAFDGRLNLSVAGGNGGNNHSSGLEWQFVPPGGGGGGGMVLTTRASIGGSVRLELAGGTEGLVINNNSHRYLWHYHAAQGGSGSYLAGRTLDRSVTRFIPIGIDAGPDISICSGWPGEMITTRPQGGVLPYSYRWTPATGLSSDTAAAPIATPNSSTTYYCEILDARGCRSIDSVKVEVLFSAIQLRSVLRDGVLVIDSTLLKGYHCSEVLLENIGTEPVTLGQATLGRNIEFSIPPGQLPLVIPPGERRGLRYCYEPAALRIDRDTMSFDLTCRHRIPLKGRGAIGLLNGHDQCGNGISLHILSDTLRRFQASAPRPNPATGEISIPILRTIPSGVASTVVRCDLYNQIGDRVATGDFRVIRQIAREGAIDQSGVFEIDCSDLPAGVYYVVLDGESWGVVIGR